MNDQEDGAPLQLAKMAGPYAYRAIKFISSPIAESYFLWTGHYYTEEDYLALLAHLPPSPEYAPFWQHVANAMVGAAWWAVGCWCAPEYATSKLFFWLAAARGVPFIAFGIYSTMQGWDDWFDMKTRGALVEIAIYLSFGVFLSRKEQRRKREINDSWEAEARDVAEKFEQSEKTEDASHAADGDDQRS
ncbi:uncharacterized protein N7459_009886 [Penicillium hispanicum]|uniref:uncharacterized protein n=1 Tax=Penicillium hispanicum TaxID=1080232 RepID=UPI002540E356|nr:uncharacterized protein N7459_009886 [Penicillium hispanicum]KAJ5570456.1 hypothetical protein N7459_009886 [Penicillium hispanicum]